MRPSLFPLARTRALAWIAALALSAILLLPAPARAEGQGAAAPAARSKTGEAARAAIGEVLKGSGPEPWRIRSETMEYETETDTYIATGHVLVWREGQRFEADRAVFDRRRNQLRAFGHVKLSAGEDVLLADSMSMDLSTETGSLENGTLVIARNNFVITGRTIQKTGPRTFTATDASITTCPGPDPDWKITGRSLRLKLESFGYVRDVVLRAGGVPVVWVPWFTFPVKLKRSTGLLAPSMSQSERKGVSWTQPFFWTVADNADVTLYDRAMTERGNMLGAEGRWAGSETDRATAVAISLMDRKTDDGTAATSTWGYSDDEVDRPNRDRYWVVGKGDWESADGIMVKADVDWVSDQDFLREFRGGPMGFDEVNENLAETYGRTLDDFNNSVRENRLHSNRSFTQHSASADVIWNDNVVARRWTGQDRTLQTLPSAVFAGVRRPVLGRPLAVSYQTAWSHFYEEDGIRGQRADLSGRFHLPFRLAPAVHLDPSVGLRGTLWHVDTWDDTPSTDRRSFSREVHDFRLDLSTELNRTFATDLSWARGLRHAVAPVVSWYYRPDPGATAAPRFDSTDALEGENTVAFSLDNSLWGIRPGGDKEGATLFQAGWLSLSQAYDVEEASEQDPARFERPGERRPFLPFASRTELYPLSTITFLTETAWSWYDNRFDHHWAGVRWTGGLGHTLYAEYRNLHGQSESLFAEGKFAVSDAWNLSGRYEYDLFSQALVDSGIFISFLAGCWSVETGFEEEPGDRRYSIRIELTGLGSLGI